MASEPGRDPEAGNTLVLMPVAILILVGLAALTVDTAAVALGQRRVSDLAAGLARDSVAALDEEAFYTTGEAVLDTGRVLALRDLRVASVAEDRALADVRCDEVTVVDERVTVRCRARVRPIFGLVLPGGRDVFEVTAVETARSAER